MTYGLYIENDSGWIQIDENFVNYILTSSGTTSGFSGDNTSPAVMVFDFSSTSIHPMDGMIHDPYPLLFVRPSVDRAGLESIADTFGEDASVFNKEYSNSGRKYSLRMPFTGALDWKLFERAEYVTPPGTGYGLNVYNASGDLAYSSAYETPRIIHITSDNWPFSAGTPYSSTNSSEPVPYILVNSAYRIDNIPFIDEEGEDPGEVTYQTVDWWYSGSTHYCGVSNWTEDHFDTTDYKITNSGEKFFPIIHGITDP